MDGSAGSGMKGLIVNTTQITQLLNIAQLAIDLHTARNATKSAKEAYHLRLAESGEDFDGLDPRKPEHAAAIKFTKTEFAAYLNAKRVAFNVQRRLDNACRKAGMLGLEGGGAK
jgi:hypothetical protein